MYDDVNKFKKEVAMDTPPEMIDAGKGETP
jgi:hypothetical protein